MIASDFFYNHPNSAYLLLLIPIFCILFFFLFRYRNEVLENLGSLPVLNEILYPRSVINFWKEVLFFCIIWILSTLALMDPQGNARYPETNKSVTQEKVKKAPLKRKAHEIIFLMDVSPSMGVKDMETGESRLDFAKDVIDEIIRRLNGETVSIYTFTSDVDKIVPSTLDHIYARLVTRNSVVDDLGVGGTDLNAALQRILSDYPLHPNEKPKTLIILSDGGDIAYEKGTIEEKERLKKTLSELIGDVRTKNLRIDAIGLGSEKGGEVPNISFKGKKVRSVIIPDLLKILANQGRGRYYNSNDDGGAARIAESIIGQLDKENPYLENYETEQQTYLDKQGEDFIYDRYYQKFLIVVLVLLSFLLLFPENWKREALIK